MRLILLALITLGTPLGAQVDTNALRSGTGLSYIVTGRGSRNIVLIHGSNLDHRMWDAEARSLSATAGVLQYDLRGHGASGDPTESYTAWDDLRGLLDEVGMEQVVVMGLSAGAGIALDFALTYPERVDALVLASPTISGYTPTERPAFFDDLISAIRAKDFEEANEVLLSSPVFSVPGASRALVREMVVGNIRLWTLDPTRQQSLSPPALQRLSDLSMPVLVLVGEDDIADIHAQAKLIEHGVAGSKLVMIPGGGHLLNLTSPQRFADELTRFLTELDAPS